MGFAAGFPGIVAPHLRSPSDLGALQQTHSHGLRPTWHDKWRVADDLAIGRSRRAPPPATSVPMRRITRRRLTVPLRTTVQALGNGGHQFVPILHLLAIADPSQPAAAQSINYFHARVLRLARQLDEAAG